jgi:EAL domain-containing protein (putative c-di-GMP-specific phosphodiesterase class I)
MLTSGKDRLLVKTMIAMGHDLGYRVVAEGIGTRAAFDLLAEWGMRRGAGLSDGRADGGRGAISPATDEAAA